MVPIDLASIFPPHVLLGYLGALFALGLGAMGVDKTSSAIGLDRISEQTLFGLAYAGGFTGIVAGGAMFHHKVSKPEFWPNVGFAAFLWIMVLVLYFFPALL